MEFNIVNLGFIKKEDRTYYVCDILCRSQKSVIKRVFIKETTYKKLSNLFSDFLDMITFDVGKYIYFDFDKDNNACLKVNEELIIAI